ncbi:hypothetical protein [Flavobacterium polysaccharolyticum]|uniref:Uncharacterized protein n=1 Tax=Flavobacterium polysaccharolyticum TaxID=3133148 RepID=A0ABU9NQ67_9FLAO
MKRIFPIIFLVSNLCISQTQVIPPKNISATYTQIIGNADPKTIVKFYIDKDYKNPNSIIVNYKGIFEYNFKPILRPKDDGKATDIILWSENEAGKKSDSLVIKVETSESLLNKIKFGTYNLPQKNSNATPTSPYNPQIYEVQPPSTTYSYRATLLNTNFTVPIARFNLVKDASEKKGDILLFNSIGAGVGISRGLYEKTTDATGETINSEFTNSFGLHFGVLFSAGSSNSENTNVFAPTVSVSVLDFQIGYGYELGTIQTNQKRSFFTIAYAIPLSKLVKGKFFIFKASKGYNSQNPLPIQPITNGNPLNQIKQNIIEWTRVNMFIQ